jgi:hypothetical protein
MTNPNITYSLNNKNSIKWDVKGKDNNYWRDLEILSISIVDKNMATERIYKNENAKILKEFHDNIGKDFN